MPWDLTPAQRKLLNLSGNRLVQPRPEDAKPLDGRVKAPGGVVGGVHVGDLLMLAALEDLAAQGNRIAPFLIRRMRAHLGITAPTTFMVGRIPDDQSKQAGQ